MLMGCFVGCEMTAVCQGKVPDPSLHNALRQRSVAYALVIATSPTAQPSPSGTAVQHRGYEGLLQSTGRSSTYSYWIHSNTNGN